MLSIFKQQRAPQQPATESSQHHLVTPFVPAVLNGCVKGDGNGGWSFEGAIKNFNGANDFPVVDERGGTLYNEKNL